ncbi:MAG TPA: matrixin family metalloprotease [Myxococcales bacterium]|nr:matrixin family metalloprotease [Myxococcales bacterium]
MSRRGAWAAAALLAAAVVTAASATPSGHKWFLGGTNPSAPYKVFDHGAANRPVNGVSWATALQTIQNSFARWVAGNVGCTSWSSTYRGTFTTPAGQAAVNGTDSQDLVIFLGGTQLGWTWQHDAATLALTTTTFYTGTGEIFDADMEINNNFSWKAGGEGNQATGYDLESIVTHEAGHFLGLSHTPASTAVMYASFAPGEVRSNLSSADLDDVCGVYPGTAPVGQIGTFCARDQDCSGTYPFCRAPAGTTTTTKICTRECNAQDCPSGYTCQASSPAGTTGQACLLKPGSADLCRFCTSDQECSTGLCAYDDQGHRWCTTTCQQAADCGAGYQCVTAGPTLTVCQPANVNGDTCNKDDIPGFTGQCTTSAQCAPGYNCTAGNYCEAPGTVGSRCELSDFCGTCTVCIGTLEEAYCRACCAGTGGGGTCSLCANPQCVGGSSCLQVNGTNDGICYPGSPAFSCQACDGSHPCNDGLPCIAGRCHALCSPDHPGRCAGCFPSNTFSPGVCGCADQVVGTGSNCGIQPSGDFIACSAGSFCAGSPPTCLALCTLGDNSSCGAGQTCSLVDGKAVCAGGSVPSGSRCGASVGACSSVSCSPGLTCYGGRCYEPCNPAAPTCNPSYGCVQVSGSSSVCACSDQRSPAYGPCGAVAGGVYVCSNGLVCLGNMCRVPCTATEPCPAGGTCDNVGGTNVCSLPAGVDAGLYAPNGGCGGCEVGGWAGVFPVLMVLVMLARATERRAAVRRRPGGTR